MNPEQLANDLARLEPENLHHLGELMAACRSGDWEHTPFQTEALRPVFLLLCVRDWYGLDPDDPATRKLLCAAVAILPFELKSRAELAHMDWHSPAC